MSPDRDIFSKRLGPIGRIHLARALERHGLGQFVSAEPVPFGLFGQNVFLTSDRGQFVFRGAPHFDWQFPTEEFFAGLIHQHGLSAPWPYLIDSSRQLFPWDFVIMPRMTGVQVA